MIASAITAPAAAPTPCSTRSTPRTATFGATVIASEAATCRAAPASNGRRRPRASESGPITSCPNASPTRVPVSVSCAVDDVVARSAVRAGSAGRYMSIVSGPSATSAPSTRIIVKRELMDRSSPVVRLVFPPQGVRRATRCRRRGGPRPAGRRGPARRRPVRPGARPVRRPQLTQLYSSAQRAPSSVTAHGCTPTPPPLKHRSKYARSSSGAAVQQWLRRARGRTPAAVKVPTAAAVSPACSAAR